MSDPVLIFESCPLTESPAQKCRLGCRASGMREPLARQGSEVRIWLQTLSYLPVPLGWVLWYHPAHPAPPHGEHGTMVTVLSLLPDWAQLPPLGPCNHSPFPPKPSISLGQAPGILSWSVSSRFLFFFLILIFYYYSITVVCPFSPSLHPT